MVQAKLEVTESGAASRQIVLTLGGTEADQPLSLPVADGYLSLISVEPYPDSAKPTAKQDLKVTLVFSTNPMG